MLVNGTRFAACLGRIASEMMNPKNTVKSQRVRMMSVDLTTRYLGLELSNPLVVSSCPLTGNLDALRQIEAAGAAAVVLPSLFEEQIEHEAISVQDYYDGRVTPDQTENYFPEMERYNYGPDLYLIKIDQAKGAVALPIIASLNGTHLGNWTRYAEMIQDAGADALELNIFHVPANSDVPAAAVEEHYLQILAAVRRVVSIPVAVKVGPYFSSLPHFVRRVVQCGADGLVLFNRYLAPDINVDSVSVEPRLMYSTRDELFLTLQWISILRQQCDIDLAATGGVHFAEDVIKSLLAGADVAMCASVVMQHGPACLETMLAELTHWLENRCFDSVQSARGALSAQIAGGTTGGARANYTKALTEHMPRM